PFPRVGGVSSAGFLGPCVPAVEGGWLLAPQYGGVGLASEPASAALARGFGPLGISEMVSFTIPANTRSQAVMRRIGMTRDEQGDFAHPRVPEGHSMRRHVLYRISAK